MPQWRTPHPQSRGPANTDATTASKQQQVTVPTSSRSTSSKSSWELVHDSVTFDANEIFMSNDADQFTAGSWGSWVLDIGFGPNSSTVTTVVTDWVVGIHHRKFYARLPVRVPAGENLYWRYMASTATVSGAGDLRFSMRENLRGVRGFARAESVGLHADGNKGTQMPDATVANTWTAYTELTASTSRAYKAFLPGYGNGDTVAGTTEWKIAYALGAASSEVDIHAGYGAQSNGEAVRKRGLHQIIHYPIPSGSRVSARGMCAGTSTRLEGSLLCFY